MREAGLAQFVFQGAVLQSFFLQGFAGVGLKPSARS